MEIKLSILICTTTKRSSTFLPQMIKQLEKQCVDGVEILYLGDNYTMKVGEKRNNLIYLSKGKYFAFVDDDDTVTDDYIQLLLKAIETEPDVIVFKVFRHHNGKKDKEAIYGIEFNRDLNLQTHYQRLPNHIMCWKKDKVADIKFENLNYGEDSDWAQRIKRSGMVTRQARINRTLYHYYFNELTTETQNF